MSIMSLQHVQLNVPADQAAAARYFYEQVIGLDEIMRPQSLSNAGRKGAWYRVGTEQELHLLFNPQGVVDTSSSHPAFIVDDLPDLRRRIEDGGHEIEEAIPIERRERFFTRDPGGNRLEFLAFKRE